MNKKLFRQIISVTSLVLIMASAITAPKVMAFNDESANLPVVDASITVSETLAVPDLDLEADYNIVYYVDNTNLSCSDTGVGSGTLSVPFCHISRGSALAEAGDLVYVLNGTYPETVYVETFNGFEGSPITFMADPTADPPVTITGSGNPTSGAAFYIVQRSYITIDGFNITNTAFKGIYAIQSDNITITNNQISYSGHYVYGEHAQGIHFDTVVNSTIDGNITFNNTCIGIRLTSESNNNVISNNISYGNYSAVDDGNPTDAAGIELDDSDNNLVIHNFVYNNEDSGINFYISNGDGSNDNLVIGNVSYGNRDHGIDNNNSSGQIIIGNTVHGNHTSGINLEAYSGGAILENNIVSDNGVAPEGGRKAYNIYVDSTSIGGTSLDYNLYHLSPGYTYQIKWNTTGYSTLEAFRLAVSGQEISGLEGDPKFVLPAALATYDVGASGGDYHLFADSPAIDSANSDAPEQPLTDIEGNSRIDDPNVPDTGAGTRSYDDRGAYERQPNVLNVTGITASDKVYDGNTVASLDTSAATLVGVNSGDDVSLVVTGAAGAFSDKNVATGKIVQVSGLTLSGDDAIYYTLTQPTTTADITALNITGAFTTQNKIYDGTADAAVLSRSLVGAVPLDDIALSGGTASFDNKSVGTGKTVTLSGAVLAGADLENYVLDSVSTALADITARDLTVSATGVNRVYDGTTDATVTLSDDGVVTDELIPTYGSASFDTKNVGTGKTVSVSDIEISGADATNYNLLNVTASTTADITSKHITGTFTADDKVYDGTYYATVLTRSLVGVIPGDDIELTGGTAVFVIGGTLTFEDKNVGEDKDVYLYDTVLIGADKDNYVLDSIALATASITPRDLTVTATGVDKIYDGTTSASVTLSDNRVLGDVLTAVYGSANFLDKNVGIGKTINVSGISISGTDAANYHLTSTTAVASADITARDLTVTATGVDRTYDGTNIATVTLSDNRIAGDLFNDSYTEATFDNKNVGTLKPVSVSGISISGTDATNYNLLNETAETTAAITAKHITGNFTAQSKTYDGTNSAVVLTRTLNDTVAGDNIVLVGGIATFDNENVGIGKTVTLSGSGLDGLDKNNYVLDSVATTTADITPRDLTVTATGVNKTYDGTTSASVTLSSDKLAGDTITITITGALFDSKDIGTGKLVTVSGISISGLDAGNYSLTSNSTTTTADIFAKHITGGFTAADKVYDGTTDATVLTRFLIGAIGGDDVNLSGGTAAFDDPNVGTDKVVTLTGATLSGDDAGNYILDSVATTTASITELLELSVTDLDLLQSINQTDWKDVPGSYAGGFEMILNPVVEYYYLNATNLVSNRPLADGMYPFYFTSYPAGFFDYWADRGVVGTGPYAEPWMPVMWEIISGNQPVFFLQVAGSEYTLVDGLQYILSSETLIEPLRINGTYLLGDYTFSGQVADDLANTDDIVVDITFVAPIELTVSGISAYNKVYDGNTTANLNTGLAELVGVVGDDVVDLDVSGAVGTFADANVANGITVTVSGLTLTGADALNYTLTQPTTSADITAKELTVAGITAENKVYDGTTSALLDTSLASLVGVVGDDVVDLDVNGAVGTFADANVADGIVVTVSGLTLSGADLGNYTLTQPTTAADITAKELTVTGITAENKVYDGNITAVLDTSLAVLVGVVDGEDVSLDDSAVSGSFGDANVANEKTVTITGLILTGDDIANYTLTQPTTTADITAKELTVTGITADDKVYDGTTSATLITDSAVLVGVVVDDVVDLDVSGAVGTFADANVANGITVTVSGLTLTGADALNYTLTQPTTSADITAKELTVTGITADNKVYDGNTSANLYTAGAVLVGVVDAEDVDIDTSAAVGTFIDPNVGVGKTVSISGLILTGTDTANYTLTQPTTTADITAKELTVTGITANNKVYDGTSSADLNTAGAVLEGVVDSEDVDIDTSVAVGTFSDPVVGVGKTVTISGLVLTGTDTANYTLTQPTTTADITAKELTVTGITADDKVYDGSTTATLITDSAILVGVIVDDVVDLDVSGAVGTFADANVADGITVTVSGLTLTGADALNYTLTQPVTNANISAKHITGGFTAADKVYDGTTDATVLTRFLNGVVSDDDVQLIGGTAAFEDAEIGVDKIVTLTGATLDGTDKGNYILDSVNTTTASITSIMYKLYLPIIMR